MPTNNIADAIRAPETIGRFVRGIFVDVFLISVFHYVNAPSSKAEDLNIKILFAFQRRKFCPRHQGVIHAQTGTVIVIGGETGMSCEGQIDPEAISGLFLE